MNAAYLVLTTAWLAGDAPAAPAPAPAAPVVSAPIGGGCGGGCGAATDACCEDQCGGKHGLFGRLKAKFKRGNSCGCEAAPTCCAPVQQQCCQAPVQQHSDCCEDSCRKHGWFGKLKGKFKRNSCGESSCDGGCGTSCGCNGGGAYGGGAYGVPGTIAPGTIAPAETIPGAPKPGEAPRKMPAPPATGSVMNGYPTIVTPVVAPRLTSEQPF